NTYSTGPNMGQPLYMSVFMNTTNTAGVTASSQPADGVGAGTQGDLATSAHKGLRVRLSKLDGLTGFFGIATGQTLKLAVLLMSPDGTISNQTLPPITVPNSPAFNNCFPSTQPVSQGAGTFDPVLFKSVDAAYSLYTSLTVTNLGTPGATGLDGSDIPAGFP